MSMGLGIFLIVIGAIVTFAIDTSAITFMDAKLIGWILMGAGLVVFLIGLVLTFRPRSVSTTSRTAVDPVSGTRVTRRDSVDGPY